MTPSEAEFDAGYRAGALLMLQAWKQRSGLILFAIWALLCVPFGVSHVVGHMDDALYYVPLVAGSAALAYFNYLISHEVEGKIRVLQAA